MNFTVGKMCMIFSSQLLLLLLLSNMGVMNTSKEIDQPIWPQMSVEMCEQLEECSYPVNLMEPLTKHLAKLTGVKLSRQDGRYSLNMTKGSMNAGRMCGSTWLHLPQDGRQENVHSKTFNKSEANEKTQAIFTKYNQIQENKFEVPPKILRENCSVLSMAKSKTYPNTIYLLLHCREMKKCSVSLHFVDFKARKMLNNRIPFWDVGSGRNQIFTSPCVKNNANSCLYLVTTKRVHVSITTNKEPATTTRHLVLLTTHYFAGFRGESFFCSVYNAWDLLCLSNGRKPSHVELRLGSMRAERKKLNWYYDRFDGINDFKIDSSTDKNNGGKSYGVVVLNSTVTVIYVDAEKKTIRNERSIVMQAMTVTLTNGVIILHGKELGQPFYTCKIDSLASCFRLRK